MDPYLIQTKEAYEQGYKQYGFSAQRRYPNEELVRFISRNYLSVSPEKRKNLKILEVGCGNCGNLWMIAKEGFTALGLDISPEALKLGREVLSKWDTHAELIEGTATKLPFASVSIDAIVDVMASFSLLSKDFETYIHEVHRVLKPGGRFFLFALGTGSDAFKNYEPASKIDKYTLNGIHRNDSPYYGCFYPHRFDDVRELSDYLVQKSFKTERKELLTRTYGNLREVFECISLEAIKVESVKKS